MFLVTDPTWPHVPSPAQALQSALEAALEPVREPEPPPAPVAAPARLRVWDRPTPTRAARQAVSETGALAHGLALPGWKSPIDR